VVLEEAIAKYVVARLAGSLVRLTFFTL